jgi:hypothetical protein
MAVEAVIFTQIVDVNWDQAIYTASPNNTINVAQFAAKGSGTNIGIALTPKGTGYISAQVPDGTFAGGNARGVGSVDWQSSRSALGQVASGVRSVIVGGRENAASGESALAGGISCTSSGQYSFAFGVSSAATQQGSVAIGSSCAATAIGSIATGRNATANIWGMRSHGFDSGVQKIYWGLVGKTTSNALVELLTPIVPIPYVLPTNTAMVGLLQILGSKTDGTAFAKYTRQVSIRRTGATTQLIGSVETVGVDEAAGTSIAVTANDVNESLKVEAAGIVGETWAWAAVFSGVLKTMNY